MYSMFVENLRKSFGKSVVLPSKKCVQIVNNSATRQHTLCDTWKSNLFSSTISQKLSPCIFHYNHLLFWNFPTFSTPSTVTTILYNTRKVIT
jgi:hypothetical protein